MVDDERLQELLAKASSLYNNGEYKGAIEAWQEALGVDPESQKAREGIRMATLLLGDSEPAAEVLAAEGTALPADGGDSTATELPPEEAEARIDLGIARLKQLLAERKYADAIAGAQGLLQLAPDSSEIQRLLEESQHAFESTPFIDEHLTLARELLAQERFSDAEAECKKVFTLEAAHPGGKALLKEIRDKIQASLKDAASQLGGMTVKLTMPQAIAAGVKFTSKATGEAPTVPDSKPAATPLPEVFTGPEPAGGEDTPQIPEPDLDAAFAPPSQEAAVPEESPFELGDTGPGGIGSPAPPESPEEIVEATTVRPVTSRVVPKAPAAEEPVSLPEAAKPQATAEPQAPLQAPPVVAGHTKKTSTPQEPPAAQAPAAAKASPSHPRQEQAPEPEVQEDAAAAWEQELTQLNLKDKERGLLRGTGAKVTPSPAEAGDMDIMSLLDTGGMPGMGGSEGAEAAPQPRPVQAVREPAKPTGHSSATKPHVKERASLETPTERATPMVAPKVRAAQRPKPAPLAARRSSKMKYLLLLLILLGGGAAAWQFDLLPRDLGRYLPRFLGARGQALAPPAGSPSGTVDATHNPIPTPIGGSSRQQALEPTQGGAPQDGTATASLTGSAAGAASAPQQVPGATQAGSGVVPAQGAGAPGPGAPGAGAPGTAQSAAAVPGGNRPSTSMEPIKPSTVPAMSREEMQSKIAAYSADGKRLIALQKWREARAKFNAVLALDPANIEIKELADKAQVKIDEEQSLMNEFDSMKSLFVEKDYENALRKLYRLPRDKGLGDIDLYIRNAWFNWAVVLLKAGNSKDALVKLSEELAVDPDDAAALKLQEVAEKYTTRAKDRTYYAFTDALQLRPFDKR